MHPDYYVRAVCGLLIEIRRTRNTELLQKLRSFTHVFLRGHYLSMICSHSLDSVIRGSSDLHQSKVYLSSGLFEIVTQTNHIPLLVMKDCSQNYYDRNLESQSIE